MRVLRAIAVFLQKDRAQDLAEYCLIAALISLIALGIILHMSGGLQGMWTSINASLATGNPGGAGPTGK